MGCSWISLQNSSEGTRFSIRGSDVLLDSEGEGAAYPRLASLMKEAPSFREAGLAHLLIARKEEGGIEYALEAGNQPL